mgnify:CR=1 FL=1
MIRERKGGWSSVAQATASASGPGSRAGAAARWMTLQAHAAGRSPCLPPQHLPLLLDLEGSGQAATLHEPRDQNQQQTLRLSNGTAAKVHGRGQARGSSAAGAASWPAAAPPRALTTHCAALRQLGRPELCPPPTCLDGDAVQRHDAIMDALAQQRRLVPGSARVHAWQQLEHLRVGPEGNGRASSQRRRGGHDPRYIRHSLGGTQPSTPCQRRPGAALPPGPPTLAATGSPPCSHAL